MTDEEIINNEKYHTCGRCKYENTPNDKYPCINCIYGTNNRTDLWELKQTSEYDHDHDVVKAYNDGQAFILDKIRADIENDWQFKKYPRSPWSCGLRRAIEIIDKYKAESEEK